MGEKLEYYDVVAHLIPGTIALLYLLLLVNALGIAIPSLGVGQFGDLGIGIAVAYTLGHLFQSVASTLEPTYYFLWGGKPSYRLLKDGIPAFSEVQRERVVDDLAAFFGMPAEDPEADDGLKQYHQHLFERCMTLCNRNRLGRVESFVTSYGFHRVMLTTFLMGTVGCGVGLSLNGHAGFHVEPAQLKILHLVFFLSLICSMIEIFRTKKRGVTYAKEVVFMSLEYVRSERRGNAPANPESHSVQHKGVPRG